MREQPDYRGWTQVQEEEIVTAVEMAKEMGPSGGHDGISFKKVLMAGRMFKAAGLHPCYVWCEHTHRLAVFAAELQGKKLH